MTLGAITVINTETSSQFRRDPDLIATEIDGYTVMMSIERVTYYGIDEATYQRDMQAFVDELLRVSLTQRVH